VAEQYSQKGWSQLSTHLQVATTRLLVLRHGITWGGSMNSYILGLMSRFATFLRMWSEGVYVQAPSPAASSICIFLCRFDPPPSTFLSRSQTMSWWPRASAYQIGIVRSSFLVYVVLISLLRFVLWSESPRCRDQGIKGSDRNRIVFGL
jgi:hypothetical protein